MAIPEVTMTVVDGGLGVLPPNTSQLHVKLGVAAGGVPNTLYSYSTTDSLEVALDRGPIVEAGAYAINVIKGPVLFMPITPSVQGAISAVTQGGAGAGTVTPTAVPHKAITAVCTLAGARGTCKFTFALGNGQPGVATLIPVGGTYLVPGTFCTLTFNAAAFDVGDTFTIALDGTITQTVNAGAGTGNITAQASSPTDAFSVLFTTVLGGLTGTMTFKYSLDGGRTTSVVIASSGGGTYVIPGAGILLTFANSFTAGDTYAFTTTTAGFATGDVTTAMTALRADSRTWGFVHLVGQASSAANSAAMFSVVDTAMLAAEAEYRFTFTLMECPTLDSGGAAILDATIITAFQAVESRRVNVAAGDCDVTSPLDGQIRRRNAAWVVAARIAAIAEGIDPAWVDLGSLQGVTALYRDERVTQALDAAGFTTLRTFLGRTGFYITNSRMKILTGDFQLVQFRRVMDTACIITRAGELPYLSQGVRVKTDGSGQIDPRDANAFDADITDKLEIGLVNRGQATGARVAMDRTVNLVAQGPDAAAPVEISIVPLGYMKRITTRIGFSSRL